MFLGGKDVRRRHFYPLTDRVKENASADVSQRQNPGRTRNFLVFGKRLTIFLEHVFSCWDFFPPFFTSAVFSNLVRSSDLHASTVGRNEQDSNILVFCCSFVMSWCFGRVSRAPVFSIFAGHFPSDHRIKNGKLTRGAGENVSPAPERHQWWSDASIFWLQAVHVCPGSCCLLLLC